MWHTSCSAMKSIDQQPCWATDFYDTTALGSLDAGWSWEEGNERERQGHTGRLLCLLEEDWSYTSSICLSAHEITWQCSKATYFEDICRVILVKLKPIWYYIKLVFSYTSLFLVFISSPFFLDFPSLSASFFCCIIPPFVTSNLPSDARLLTKIFLTRKNTYLSFSFQSIYLFMCYGIIYRP